MQFFTLPLLSAAILLAQSASAAYVNLDPSPYCGGTPVVTFNLVAGHQQCFQRQTGEASLYINLDTFSCTVQLFSTTIGTCSGAVTGALAVSKNAHGCIDFQKTAQDVLIVCASA